MKILNVIRSFISSSVRKITYALLGKFYKSTWVHIPEQVLSLLIARLSIGSFSYHLSEGNKYPLLITNKLKFVGPSIGDDICCSPYFEGLYRQLQNTGSVSLSDIDQVHIGLLHNVLNRFLLEQSSLPYMPIRTFDIPHDCTFVDIGAFRGYLSVKAANQLSNAGKVLSFEPILENFKILKLHKDLNDLQNLEVYNSAITLDESEQVEFYRSFNQINSEIPDHVSNESTSTIKVANFSVSKLCEKIGTKLGSGIFMSITTNGTEVKLSKAIVKRMLYDKMPLERIVIPIHYTQKEFSKEISFFENLGFSIRVEYPWGVIENENNLK